MAGKARQEDKMGLDIGEFELISRLAPFDSIRNDGVVLGVGDDAAALAVTPGNVMLATCDSQIEGKHFRFDFSNSFDVGKRAAAVNLSDIAAMGGVPRYALVSLAISEGISLQSLMDIYAGMREQFAAYNTYIVGGNTTSTTGPFMIDITLLGETPQGRMLVRSGARPGDLLCVTGELGASRSGLMHFLCPELSVEKKMVEEGIIAYRTPQPRVAVGALLARKRWATSCMDISDGLAGDARHLSSRSCVAITIELDKIPISTSAQCMADLLGEIPCEFAAKGGEDFELLFTISSNDLYTIQKHVMNETGVAVTPVGSVSHGEGVRFAYEGKHVSLNLSGYNHLSNH